MIDTDRGRWCHLAVQVRTRRRQRADRCGERANKGVGGTTDPNRAVTCAKVGKRVGPALQHQGERSRPECVHQCRLATADLSDHRSLLAIGDQHSERTVRGPILDREDAGNGMRQMRQHRQSVDGVGWDHDRAAGSERVDRQRERLLGGRVDGHRVT